MANGPYQPVATSGGESPIATLPQYGGAGGSQQAAAFYAGQQFYKLFGRNPTQSELDSITPAYISGDPNIAGVAQGNAAVAQYYQSKVNTPEKQYADQQAGYKAEAPKYYDQINGQFQSTLGRDATQEEKDHFGSLLASGQVDPYTVGQFLHQLPEAVTKQDTEFRSNLRNDISAQDSRYFGEQILPGIQRNFAQQGRSVESSGFANAAAQAGQQQNVNREGFLSNLSASQYTGNKTNAYNEYLNSVGRMQGLQDHSRARGDTLADASTGRINEISNFAMQKQAYDQYLSRYGKRGNGLGGMLGTLLGAGIGGAAGKSPQAAMAGGQVGGSIGNYFGQQ